MGSSKRTHRQLRSGDGNGNEYRQRNQIAVCIIASRRPTITNLWAHPWIRSKYVVGEVPELFDGNFLRLRHHTPHLIRPLPDLWWWGKSSNKKNKNDNSNVHIWTLIPHLAEVSECGHKSVGRATKNSHNLHLPRWITQATVRKITKTVTF